MTDFHLPEEFDFSDHFDHRTLTRAIELKPQQSVLSLQVDGPKLHTRVQGSGTNAYQQTIRWVVDRRLGPRLESRCSCPIGHDCQHVAAALMAYEAQQIRIRKGLPETPGVATPVARPAAPPPPPAMIDLGTLPLVPVLRLSTCVDVASEALLHHRYGSAAARGTTLRQASAQVLFRYPTPQGGRPFDYHFPAGSATTTVAEMADPVYPGRSLMGFFQRKGPEEAAALRTLFNDLELRPWSLSAGLALDRLTRIANPRLQAPTQAAHSLEGSPLILVPQRREQWATLLAQQIPQLEAEGWQVELADDFPFEMHKADDWAVEVAEEAGGHWFNVGLKVTVEGKPVDIVPLLVGLVQSGWLSAATVAQATDGGDVLVPWVSDEPVAAGMPLRQRLLRLPLARVAPLIDWLRTAFQGAGSRGAALRLSRFDLGTLEAVSTGARVTAPPSFTELVNQLQQLGSGQALPEVPVSPQVQATLRHYQSDGLSWMDFLRRARLGGVLADDMGLGKTLQALALLQGELDGDRAKKPSLVVVPTSLIGNWVSEAHRFTPGLRVVVLHGSQRSQHFKHIANAHLVVTSYPLAVRDIQTLAAQDWHYLMLDEAQRIKNSRSLAAVSMKGLRADHRLCLSGTPLENHLGELWSLMDFVCPGLLGSEPQFREHYRTPIERRQDRLRAEQLARRVRPFILRRTKQQVAQELPEKTETHLRVELAGAQRDLYETVRATMDAKLRDAIEKQGLARSQIMVLDALLKLRQVCCDPRLLKLGGDGTDPAAAKAHHSHPSAKMELLLDLLPTLVEDGRRILLFSQFTEMLALIEAELVRLKLPYLKLTGETKDRSQLVSRFQEGDVPLFLISLKAGGVGLNLTAADTVILYDPWWNPAVEQQAIDRAYRIGQDKPVFVYKLLASGTVEDKMLEMQARKAGLADSLLSGVASDAGLSAEDFDELFKPLGKD
jgi:superfamily II DNA or RNA helicase